MAKLTIIAGPMFSGKTEELIRLLHRSNHARKRISVIKPKIDVRSKEEIVSRRTSGGQEKEFTPSGSWNAVSINSPAELAEIIKTEQPDILGVDEAQFFEPWLLDSLVELLYQQRGTDLHILVAGLDMDAWGQPFGIMPQLMAIADEVKKETAICFKCGNDAMLTQKLIASNQQVEVGDYETYEARCRVCHSVPDSV